jgi:integrase
MEQGHSRWSEATTSAQERVVNSRPPRDERRNEGTALFNLAIDSKLRACDLVRLRVEDLWSGSAIRDRATIIQKKTKRPVQFEVTEQTKIALAAWLPSAKRTGGSYLFPGRRRQSTHLSTRQYARIVQ